MCLWISFEVARTNVPSWTDGGPRDRFSPCFFFTSVPYMIWSFLNAFPFLQIHDVEFCCSLEQIVEHTLPALLDLKSQGKVRHIGITGYNLGTLKRIVELASPGSIDTVLSYCRFTLFNKGREMTTDLYYTKERIRCSRLSCPATVNFMPGDRKAKNARDGFCPLAIAGVHTNTEWRK